MLVFVGATLYGSRLCMFVIFWLWFEFRGCASSVSLRSCLCSLFWSNCRSVMLLAYLTILLSHVLCSSIYLECHREAVIGLLLGEPFYSLLVLLVFPSCAVLVQVEVYECLCTWVFHFEGARFGRRWLLVWVLVFCVVWVCVTFFGNFGVLWQAMVNCCRFWW